MQNRRTDASSDPSTLPALVTQFDAALRIVYIGPESLAWLGVAPGVLVGRSLREHLGEAGYAVLQAEFAAALAGRPGVHERESAAGGPTRIVQVNLSPRIGAQGAVDGVFMVESDVTALRRAETAVREADALFEGAFESAAAGIGLMTADGRWLRVNRAFSDMVGYSAQELVRMRFVDITHPADLDKDQVLTRRMLEGEIPGFAMDKRYVRKDGRVIHVHLTVAAVRDVEGRVRHTVSQVIDVTRHYEVEAALREREILFRAMSEASPFGIFVDDRAGECIYVNPAYERITGLSRDEALGRGWYRALHPDDLAVVLHNVGQRGEVVERVLLDHRYRHANGKVVLARVRIGVMRDAERLIGFVGVVEDITDARHNEEEVQRLNADLERRVAERTAALARSMDDLESFSYSVSHDLRAPLRALDAFGAMLLEKQVLDAEARGFLSSIRASSQRMARLIDDLLALSQTGRRRVVRTDIDLAALGRSIVDELHVAQPGREVEFHAPARLPAYGDLQLVRALLQNLLDNAWKFSAGREVARIELGSLIEDGATVYFVRDNGVGFDEAYVDKVFMPFQRLHRVDDYAGSGIGLASAKRIVLHHGGRLWATSVPGRGATFLFTLTPVDAGRGTSA
jgi:PAS domain S-box-containing protein